MKVQNSLAPNSGSNKKDFTSYINGEKIKNLITDRLGGDIQRAARLIATISTVVASNPKLQECEFGTIVSAALTGEVGMNLSLALGDYGIIPYGNTAKFQLQVNGLKQLCIRSKAYSKIDCFEVYEGEFAGRDPRTREPIFNWIEDEDEKLDKPIIGYYAFYQLADGYNNFFNCLYWSHEKILKHADRYSQAFSLEKYRDLLAGKLDKEEVERLQGTKKKKGSSPWYANPDDDAHIKMCKKTVLKQLLNDGLAPKSIKDLVDEDDATEREDAPAVDIPFPTVPVADEETDGAIESTAEPVQEAQEAAQSGDASEPKNDAPEEKPKRRGRPPRSESANQPTADPKPHEADDEMMRDFFGDGMGGELA